LAFLVRALRVRSSTLTCPKPAASISATNAPSGSAPASHLSQSSSVQAPFPFAPSSETISAP
jgi:hypothetical protein